MLQFILPIERVVVVGSFFINHHVALGETVCSLSDAAPRPLPAHYSLAVLRMCACESSVCSCPADFFFFCHRDPHYGPHTVTSICFPPLPLSCSCRAVLSAPSAPCTGLIWIWGEMAGKHKEIRHEVREREQIWESGR